MNRLREAQKEAYLWQYAIHRQLGLRHALDVSIHKQHVPSLQASLGGPAELRDLLRIVLLVPTLDVLPVNDKNVSKTSLLHCNAETYA